MDQKVKPTRSDVETLVISTLRDVLSQGEKGQSNGHVTDSTLLIGQDSDVDSLGLVTLVVDLEEKLNMEYGMALTLADDRAMSQKNSPFRSVQSLTDYVCALISEQQ